VQVPRAGSGVCGSSSVLVASARRWGARRKEAAIINTPPSELDGTVAGIFITAIVATLGLVILLGMVYWANSHPDVRKPKAQQPGKAHRPVRTADPRRAVPSPKKPGSTSPRASAASSPAQALDPEPAASRRDKSGLPVIIFASLTSLFTLAAWLLHRRRTSGRPQDHPGH